MPIENELYRNAIAQTTLKRIGRSIRNPFYRTGQLTHSDYQAAIGKLPHGDSPEIQVMDSSSPSYGRFFYLVDFDDIDDPNVVIP